MTKKELHERFHQSGWDPAIFRGIYGWVFDGLKAGGRCCFMIACPLSKGWLDKNNVHVISDMEDIDIDEGAGDGAVLSVSENEVEIVE